MTNHRLIKISKILIALAGIIVGLLYLNSAAYHLWLADGPPVENAEAHLNAFYRHFLISLLGFVVFITIIISSWFRKRKLRKPRSS